MQHFPRYIFSGDKEKAKSLYIEAWNFYKRCKATIAQDINIIGPFYQKFHDGTIYTVSSVHNQQIIEIFVPPPSHPKEYKSVPVHPTRYIGLDWIGFQHISYDDVEMKEYDNLSPGSFRISCRTVTFNIEYVTEFKRECIVFEDEKIYSNYLDYRVYCRLKDTDVRFAEVKKNALNANYIPYIRISELNSPQKSPFVNFLLTKIRGPGGVYNGYICTYCPDNNMFYIVFGLTGNSVAVKAYPTSGGTEERYVHLPKDKIAVEFRAGDIKETFGGDPDAAYFVIPYLADNVRFVGDVQYRVNTRFTYGEAEYDDFTLGPYDSADNFNIQDYYDLNLTATHISLNNKYIMRVPYTYPGIRTLQTQSKYPSHDYLQEIDEIVFDVSDWMDLRVPMSHNCHWILVAVANNRRSQDPAYYEDKWYVRGEIVRGKMYDQLYDELTTHEMRLPVRTGYIDGEHQAVWQSYHVSLIIYPKWIQYDKYIDIITIDYPIERGPITVNT